jgi:hypothetical protein
MRFVLSKKSPEWGLGVVLKEQSPGKLDTLFLEGGRRLLVESMAALEPVDDTDVPPDSPLRNPEQWSKVEHHKQSAATFAEMVKEFLTLYPEGFQDPTYLKSERNYKESAVEKARQLLAQDRLSSLLASAQYEQCHRTATDCAALTNLMLTSEKSRLKAIPPEAHQAFANQFFDLLYGKRDYSKRVETFANRLLRYDAGKWTIATYFGFLQDPVARVFVKPTAVQRAAKALHRDLKYDAEPSAEVYARVVSLCEDVKAQLEAAHLRPADMVDVQGFLWIGTGLHREVR